MAVRRKQRFVDGLVEWPTMLYARRCSLVDLSSTGAKIELAEDDTSASRVPTEVTLHIVTDRRRVACTVVWRRGRQAGLKFKGPLREA